jgi:antibiotic biosynthesis monooxygenase (ABM) superfamily enzyme
MMYMGDTLNEGVTKIIDRVPRPGMETQLEDAIKNLNRAAMQFPGHLGVNVTKPSLPAQPGYRSVYKFDSSAHLRAWEESDTQHRLVAIANRYTQGAPGYKVLTGLETWFTLPAPVGTPHPPRSRMTVVTWLGIFPLVYLYGLAINWLAPTGTPAIVHVLVVTLFVVPTMSYVVAPRLTRLFKNWLYPEAK